MVTEIIFYSISFLLLLCAIQVVTVRSVFSSALYLAGALSMVAALFVLLGADFLAAVQILLYVGGILVILVFAVMLSSVQQAKLYAQVNEQWVPSLIVCLGLFLLIGIGLKRVSFVEGTVLHAPTTKGLGTLLLGGMILPFEVVSLILLASLVGAILFSRKT